MSHSDRGKSEATTQQTRVQERFTRTAGEFAAFSQTVRAAEAAQLLELLRRGMACANERATADGESAGGSTRADATTRGDAGAGSVKADAAARGGAAGASGGAAANIAAAMRGMRAVDVACGPGTFTLAFAPHVGRMTALDITAAILEKARAAAARENIGPIEWVLGNAQKLPWPTASLDLVTTAYSLHHIGNAAHAVAEIARVLKPGGWLALVDCMVPEPGFDSDLNNAIEIARDASHVRTFTGTELCAMAQQAALTVMASEPGVRARSFDDWMRIAGWKRGDAAYADTRRLMEQNIPQDRSGFAPRRGGDAADADIEWTQASFFLVARRA